ncbi:unnamed protein product [marine sediment metagenome]|uniref:Uncharacterized protein n=1 Tax=marine sediment metagenome TaxID=412755 RepID=X1N0H8_9ZZZZ
MMTLAVVLLLVGLLGTVIGGILYMRRRTDGLYGDVQGAINDFFDPKDADSIGRNKLIVHHYAKAPL